MLAIFPGMAALIALWGFFADPLVIDDMLELGADFLPPEAFRLIDRQALQLANANDSTLGWTTLLSIVLALWWSRTGVEALIRGLNAVHRRSNRMGMRQMVTPIVLTLTLVAVSLVALASVVITPIILAFLPVDTMQGILLSYSRWAIAAVVIVFGLSLLYRYGPNRDGEHRRGPWLTPGIFVALAVWAAASWLFSLYIQNFARYNEIYGTLGAAVILLLWFYIGAYAVLLGASLNAKLDRNQKRRRERESRPAPPIPDDM
ncbi:YihY/virulence factor BrkB family protein [Rhodobacteraceae bacterium MCCB 386]|nr:YihY/virulence factor BrkB family protein [Roseitranquillus sediminis]